MEAEAPPMEDWVVMEEDLLAGLGSCGLDLPVEPSTSDAEAHTNITSNNGGRSSC